MNGVYKVKGDWDKYIDDETEEYSFLEKVNICRYETNFINLGNGNYCRNVREYYYNYAYNYLHYGTTGDELPYSITPTFFAKNPLKTEALFMVMQKDLNDVSW